MRCRLCLIMGGSMFRGCVLRMLEQMGRLFVVRHERLGCIHRLAVQKLGM
jgi:hypothetical protein